MRVIQFVANISYNNVSRLVFVPWVEATHDNLLNAVVQEFAIPPIEASRKGLCDVDGTLYTTDSFEQIVFRSINGGGIPHIKVVTIDGLPASFVTPSNNQRQEAQVAGLRRVNNLFSSLVRAEDNLNETEVRSRPQLNEPTQGLNEPEVNIIELHLALKNREVKLNAHEELLLQFESRLKKREDAMNRRDVELNKLRKRLNKRDDKLKNREANMNCREIELDMQYYALSKLEDILHRLSAEFKMRKQQLTEHESWLNQKEAMLDEERSKIKPKQNSKTRGRRSKMEADTDSDRKEEDTQSNEEASSVNYHQPKVALSSIVLDENLLMAVETHLKNFVPAKSSSSGTTNKQRPKPNGSHTPLTGKLVISINTTNKPNSTTGKLN